MAKWNEDRPDSDNPNAEALIFFGDGKGNFHKTTFAKGIGFHEARVTDLNGDGRMDIINKPYNWKAPTVEVWLQLPPNEPQKSPSGSSHQKIEIGLQLYSLRASLAKDVSSTLALVRQMNFTDIEVHSFFGKTASEFRKELDQLSLKASGVDFLWERLDQDINGAINDAKALGCEYLVMPWIPHQGAFNIEAAKIAVEKFNHWGKTCSDNGLKFCYHIHGFEFLPHAGGTIFDFMLANTNAQHVSIELDIFWALYGGADPVQLLRKYPDRFPLIHLKDMHKEMRIPNSDQKDIVESNVTLGAGRLDVPAIMAEAARIGIKHYYIEDESSKSIEQIPKSIEYVRSLGY
jgi:sugar phosphate isomerase/epimerase